jgi:hypothetical protein
MSEAPEKDSKTEEATSHKLQQAYEKGDGPRTMDLGSAATLAAVRSRATTLAAAPVPAVAAAQGLVFLSHGGDAAPASAAKRKTRAAIMSTWLRVRANFQVDGAYRTRCVPLNLIECRTECDTLVPMTTLFSCVCSTRYETGESRGVCPDACTALRRRRRR